MAAQLPGPGTRLDLNVEKSPAGAVVRCVGVITASTMGPFMDRLHPLVAESKQVVLDLGQITYIDSSGLGGIVRLWSSGQKSNCALQVSNVPPRIKELLSLTSLASIFQC